MFFQGYAFTAVLAGLMSTFLVIRHTRTDEELGRAELIGSAPIPRAASLTVNAALRCGRESGAGRGVAAGFAAAGLPGPGSVTAGAAVGAVGPFSWPSPRIAQFMPSGRAPTAQPPGLVGAAYFFAASGMRLAPPVQISPGSAAIGFRCSRPSGGANAPGPFPPPIPPRCWS